MKIWSRLFLSILAACLLVGSVTLIAAQDPPKKPKLSGDAKKARDYALSMLDEMQEILKENYYDPTFHGMDLKARIETAKERVKTLEFNWQMYRVLAQVLVDLNDSHTFFMLPPRDDHFQYGVGWQTIGDNCFVTSVKKDSDAFAQGVEVGDQVLLMKNFRPSRENLWKMEYVIYKLDPANHLELKIRKPDGTEKELSIKAKTMNHKEFRAYLKAHKEKQKFEPFKCQEVNKEVIACRLETFMVEKDVIDKMMTQVRAYPKFILDLRGNGGGLVTTEEYFVSQFFDRQVKIADMVTKKKTENRSSKILDAAKQYKGEVAILVDSDSASASEITARVLQLEKRARSLVISAAAAL